MSRLSTFIILLTAFPFYISASDSTKIIKILPVPAFGYSPETKTYVGAVSLFTIDLYRDSLTRTSNATFEFNYTWNRQLILSSEWKYFFKEEKWFSNGSLSYSGYPDFYYGIGSNTPASNELLYNSNRWVFEINILKNLGKKFFIGPELRYISYSKVNFTGETVYPELADQSTFGAGITLLKDSRDNLLTPTKGFYLNFSTGYNFSKSNYLKTAVDVRIYKTWKGKYTWANRLINEFNSGTIPFYDYAFMGGDKFVRGYKFGRYRDKNLTSLQTELRLPVVWKFGAAFFGGLSNLYSDNFSPDNSKYNYGLGLRFLVDKHDRTNLRIDYAIGEDGNDGFYISFGESF
jgi:outer membrane protein assembly factor BamA